MPNSAAAKKHLRQSDKRRLANRSQKAELRTQIKKAKDAIAASSEETPIQVSLAKSKLDRAVKKNLLHRNKAARMKSQLDNAANVSISAKE